MILVKIYIAQKRGNVRDADACPPPDSKYNDSNAKLVSPLLE